MGPHLFDSRLGNIFVIIFGLVSIVLAATSFFCSSASCGVLLVFPILPWAVVLETYLALSLPWAIYPFLLLLNTIVVYSLGVLIESLLAVGTRAGSGNATESSENVVSRQRV